MAPAIAPPMTFFLSAFGSEPCTFVRSSADVGSASADTLYVLSFTTIDRTRNVICAFSALSPDCTDATSSTTVDPAGSSAPREPVIGASSVAASLSPTMFDVVQIFDVLVTSAELRLEVSPRAGAGAAATTCGVVTGAGCETT